MSEPSATVTHRNDAGEETVQLGRFDEPGSLGALDDLRAGATVGRYMIVSRLGAGAMGVVYGAYDPKLDRKVAIKVLRGGERTVRSERRRARLEREAKALARMAHPNVVTVFDVGTIDDRVWIAMEFVQGVTLRRWLARENPSRDRILEVMMAAGRGLEAAHHAGLIHRDFKPDNVMVELGADESGDGQTVSRVLVMDFGLARSQASESGQDDAAVESSSHRSAESGSPDTELTQHGDVVGTPAYMAPEQHLAEGADARSDQFAFCIVLWEALFKQRPFGGGPADKIGSAVVAGRICHPPVGHGISRWLMGALERGLQTAREDRWPSMGALLATLEQGRARRGVRAIATLGIATVLVMSGVGGWHAWMDSVRNGCRASGAEISELWPGRADPLQRALADDGTYDRTRPWLDEWAGAWSSARADVCERRRLHGQLDDNEERAAVACLAAQRAEAAAMLDSMVTGTPGASRDAVLHAAALPRPESCTDPGRLHRGPWPEPGQWDTVQSLRQRIASAGARIDRRVDDELVANVEQIRAEAEEVGWTPLEAEAWRLTGRLLMAQGSYQEAEGAHRQAYLLAGKVGADALAAQIAIDLARLVGTRQARHDAGLSWTEHAKMMLERSGAEHELLDAELQHVAAVLDKERGEFDRALRGYERVREHYVRLLGEVHPRHASLLTDLANVYNEQAQYQRALSIHRRAREIWETILGPRHPTIALALGNEAIVQYQQGDLDAALEKLVEVRAMNEATYGPDHPELGKTLLNLAAVLRAASREEEALQLNLRALEVFEGTLGSEHPLVAAALNNIGLLKEASGELDAALEHYERALAVKRQVLGPQHPGVVSTLNNIAVLHRRREAFDEARKVYEEALLLAEQANGLQHPAVAGVLDGLGDAFFEAGDPAGAVPLLERALGIYEANEVAPHLTGNTRFSLAQALWEDPSARTRAVEQAEQALGELGDSDDHHSERVAEISAWLETHRVSP